MSLSGKDKSSLDRVVGGDEKEQAKIEAGLRRRFEDQAWSEDLKRAEREKTDFEIEAIHVANRMIDALREKYGLSAFEVPAENVHILRDMPELTKRIFTEPDHDGTFDYENQWVVLLEQLSRLETLALIVHELIHFKSYLSVEPASFGGVSGFAPHRDQQSGLRITDEQERVSFHPLNEAVTEELTRRLMERTRDMEALSDEWESLDRVRASQPPETAAELQALSPRRTPDGQEKLVPSRFKFLPERQALNLLVRKLRERDPQDGRDTEVWFDLFAGAMFNGHLLELEREIEAAFGEGSFRRLGEPQNGEELLQLVESLEYVDRQDRSEKN